MAAAPRAAVASQRWAPGRLDRRPGSRPRRVGGLDRRGSAGPTRCDPRDAGPRPTDRCRRRLRRPRRPQHRYPLQACDGRPLLPRHAACGRSRRPAPCRGLPTHVGGRGARGRASARAASRVPVAPPLHGLQPRCGGVPPGAPRRRGEQVPGAQDGATGRGELHLVHHGAVAVRHVARGARLRPLPDVRRRRRGRLRDREHPAGVDVVRHRDRLHRRGPVLLPRAAGRVRRSHLHRDAGPAQVLRGCGARRRRRPAAASDRLHR